MNEIISKNCERLFIFKYLLTDNFRNIYGKYHFKEQLSPDAPLVFLGRIDPIKGAHIAIHVAQQTGNSLIIAGNVIPQFQDYFDQSIKTHLSANIRYIGPVDNAQENELFSNSKAFIFPLQWQEPFGIPVIEFMACGTSVLAFSYNFMPELI
ncbi:glycosyltransferase [Akkermansia sp.]|uniref:glycosyltransferase n=1 Tax=Akkermansia sp. TaxID=1872421 RepID=UPI0025C0E1D4|nr:glycosyltransferase [Akkermansia sp.]MCC8149605.1 glycosyltransferase [Akkermansia sp.]